MGERDGAGREKGVDAALATALITDTFTIHRPGDLLTLVAGDMDYIPAINGLASGALRSMWSSGPRA